MNPVRLKITQKLSDAGAGFEVTFTTVAVKVQNLARRKNVVIHYTPDNVNWTNKAIPWVAPTFGNYDLFSGTINEHVEKFAIRYTVRGETFWDNNDGQNYDFQGNLTTIGGNVALYKATAHQGTEAGGGFTVTTSWLEGEIVVNNFGFSKNVGIVITADGGATWTTVDGNLAGTTTSDGKFIGSGQVWTFKTPELNLNPASDKFIFAVFHHDLASGKEFWDNNFGQNYQLSKDDGETLD